MVNAENLILREAGIGAWHSPGDSFSRETPMSDWAARHAKTANAKKKRSTSAGLLFALSALVILIVLAAAFVALVLWPRWPAATLAPDAPALPITVGDVLFNVPPGAIRVAMES